MASTPGGGVHYAGRALARLGAHVRVVTRLDPRDESLLAPLRAEGAEIRALPSRETTTYVNDYGGPVDRHDLQTASDRIEVQDVPHGWLRADVVQIAPLHPDDIAPGIAERVEGMVGLDPQGLLRRRREGRTVLLPNPDLALHVAGVRVLHLSESELDAACEGDPPERFLRRMGVRELVVTRGDRGVVLFEEGRSSEVPAPSARAHHPIGAGDVFLACYLWLRSGGGSPIDAARGAVGLCAVHVEKGEIPKGFDGETGEP